MSFISPEIGEKYHNIINEIEEETWWSVSVNQTYNQNEILNIGLRLFSEYNIPIKKNLAFLPKERVVRAVVVDEYSDLDIIKKSFQDITGLEIKIVKK